MDIHTATEEAYKRGYADGRKAKDKYRWHDLRKDPKDLPKDAFSSVIAWDKNMNRCVFAQHTGNEWVLRGNGGIYFPAVIAWREIEEFGEML